MDGRDSIEHVPMSRPFVDRLDEQLIPRLRSWAAPLLRYSLAVVFIWFGALKVFGASPVVDLVDSMVYWADPSWFVPALGVVEVLIGLGLAFGVGLRLVLAALIVQLAGTFLVFFLLPEVAFQGRNPLALTVEGEFVVKNLVLIAAAMAVGSQLSTPEEPPR